MHSPFAGKATNDVAATADAPVDWWALKADVVSRLDVAAEYETLGIEFTRADPDTKGRRECRAIGRPDLGPSAFVNVRTGVYHDAGGEGESLHLFAFATRHGGFGRWIDAARHYADKAGVPIGKVQVKSRGRIFETHFDYLDEHGQVRYRVYRYVLPNGKKEFSQHPPDGRGGWKWQTGCMDGVEPLPYRLPDLISPGRADEHVWIVEGEKAAEVLAARGLLATTNHGGSKVAHKTWPHFVERFRGRDCLVLPDQDAGGLAHANKVCGYLEPVARSVKRLDLPGLAAKQDVVDWLAEGGSIEELGRLAHAAPEWSPEAPVPPEDPPVTPPVDGLPPDDDVRTICLSDVVAVPVEWLWPERIPMGKITLFAGQAKQGKSFLTMDLAARVSANLDIPCGGGECMPQGSVILLSAEDDLADTIKPRLIAAGADVSKIHAMNTIRLKNGLFGPFDLSYVPHLEKAVVRSGDAKLVIIDPVPHYVGRDTDDHKNSEIRQLLEPLREMAARLRVAVVIVTHLNKGSGSNALNRVTGSGAYTAMARANWLICKDKDDPKRRLFLSAGNNLVEEPSGLAYRIDREARRIVWDDKPVLMTADEALEAVREDKQKEKEKPRVNRAEQARAFLVEALADGRELPHDELVAMAFVRGISKNAIFEAKQAAGVRPRKAGFQGKWYWSIPAPEPVREQEEPIF